MGAAQRMKDFRERIREQGMVDIRVEVSRATRERIKEVAKTNNVSMKDVIRQRLEQI
jgi:hypothetical protein